MKLIILQIDDKTTVSQLDNVCKSLGIGRSRSGFFAGVTPGEKAIAKAMQQDRQREQPVAAVA